jgi:hypothetical protein
MTTSSCAYFRDFLGLQKQKFLSQTANDSSTRHISMNASSMMAMTKTNHEKPITARESFSIMPRKPIEV